MPKASQKRTKENHFIQEGNLLIPLQVIYERRRSIRVSIGKRYAYLRLPIQTPSMDAQKEIQRAKHWIKKKVSDNEILASPFEQKKYQTGDIYTIGSNIYTLDIKTVNKQTHSAKLVNNIIHLRLAPNFTSRIIKRLISRVISKDLYPWIADKVKALNLAHFQQNIKGVKLKYNISNWGSCSSSGNINLSTRLFFAPERVLDYVIIHELTHLIEMNHSAEFYRILSDIVPDYKLSERWLKTYGHQCDF